ncbi:MAG TPA: hypothetical protein VMT11_18935 [Myxococcaceae bacterium]|nr:hypothetical protein [Myxococcaceae bacterium]
MVALAFAALEHASEDERKGFQDEFKKLRSEGSEVTAALTAGQRRLRSRGRKVDGQRMGQK